MTPLGEELAKEMDDDKVTAKDDPKIRGRYLADEHEWDVGEARKIWAFGPEGSGPNVVVDTSKGVQVCFLFSIFFWWVRCNIANSCCNVVCQ